MGVGDSEQTAVMPENVTMNPAVVHASDRKKLVKIPGKEERVPLGPTLMCRNSSGSRELSFCGWIVAVFSDVHRWLCVFFGG